MEPGSQGEAYLVLITPLRKRGPGHYDSDLIIVTYSINARPLCPHFLSPSKIPVITTIWG
eukprot:750648-Hanusia_phi.AAC.6